MSRITKINVFLSLAMLLHDDFKHGGGQLILWFSCLWLLGAVGLALEGAAAWALRKHMAAKITRWKDED